jgi:hypothetical protein
MCILDLISLMKEVKFGELISLLKEVKWGELIIFLIEKFSKIAV